MSTCACQGGAVESVRVRSGFFRPLRLLYRRPQNPLRTWEGAACRQPRDPGAPHCKSIPGSRKFGVPRNRAFSGP